MNAAAAKPSEVLAAPMCGTCAAGKNAVLTDTPVMFGTRCEGCTVAATGLYAYSAPTAAEMVDRLSVAPVIELVTLMPATLDPVTHAKQALKLVASWTQPASGDDAIPRVADEFICKQAVEAVERVHRMVQQTHNRK